MTPMVQTQAGTMVPASTRSEIQGMRKKFLLVIQYFDGDKEQAEAMATLIADLERIRNRDVDVLIFARSDASPFSPDIVAKLKMKFNAVLEQRSTRKDAKGYPFGSNGMFYDLVTMLGQDHKWLNSYYAFLNLEPDCCPMAPGWLTRLIEDFAAAVNQGFSAIGHIHDDPVRHMNGVAVYAIDIWRRVPGGALGGGTPQTPFDIRQAKNLLPLSRDTDLVYFEYQKATITPEELFSNPKGAPLALYHGVKDDSAREAVRAKYITFASQREFSRKAVFTFYNPVNESNGEEKTALNLWREGWISRGWNPIVLRVSEAMKNGRFAALSAFIDTLPNIGDKFAWRNRWLRWLALDTVGGGLYADVDVLPADFTPRTLDGISGLLLLDPMAKLFYADKSGTCSVLDYILSYSLHEDDQSQGKPHVQDTTILNRRIREAEVASQVWTAQYEEPGYESARAVTFPGRLREKMENFLRTT